MFLRYEVILMVSLMILFYSCNPLDQNSVETNMLCDDFYIQGQIKNDSYTFCGTIPQEINYSYKIGDWQYWNSEGTLVAKGTYQTEKYIVEDKGGCSYEITQGIIDETNWIFLNERGNRIPPNKELIEKLQSCDPIKIE